MTKTPYIPPRILLETWYAVSRQHDSYEASRDARKKLCASFGSWEKATAHLKEIGIIRGH